MDATKQPVREMGHHPDATHHSHGMTMFTCFAILWTSCCLCLLLQTVLRNTYSERNARRLLDFKPISSLQYQSWLAHNLCPQQEDGAQHEAFKQLLLKFTGLPLKLDSLETIPRRRNGAIFGPTVRKSLSRRPKAFF